MDRRVGDEVDEGVGRGELDKSPVIATKNRPSSPTSLLPPLQTIACPDPLAACPVDHQSTTDNQVEHQQNEATTPNVFVECSPADEDDVVYYAGYHSDEVDEDLEDLEEEQEEDDDDEVVEDEEEEEEEEEDQVDGHDEEEDDDGLPYPGFIPVTLGFMTQYNRPRNLCLRMITNPWFERVSMAVIFFNCVTLGMYQPCIDQVCNTSRCRILQMLDDFIFAFFALEMSIKMIAMGVYGKGTYLAETWNRLDCFIVIAGAVEYCLDMENMNLSAIRTIRVLRPLRAINRIPSMRILVMLLLDTLPMLGNVLLLCFFVFFIFGIVGVQLWAGILRQRCYLDLPKGIVPPATFTTIDRTLPIFYKPKTHYRPLSSYYKVQETEKDYICSLAKDSGMHTCSSLPHTKSDGRVCNDSVVPGIPVGMDGLSVNGSCINWNQYYTDCRAGEKNPFQGAISFDNIGLAWVAIFLVISLEGWTDIMYYVQDAHSFWDWVYFVLLIVIGSFFMINLCLVVIATQFSETKKREMERMRLERARYQSTSTLASTSASESASCYRQIIKYIAHLWRRSKRRILRRYRAYRSRKRQLEQQQQQQLDHPQYGKQQSATHSLSLRTRRKQQRRRKRRRRRSRHPHPECPKHGVQQQEQQQQQQQQRHSQCSSSFRVPSVSSQVALRINDGPASPLDSPVPILSHARRASVAVSIDHQRSSPFLSPRGSLALADDSSDSSQLLTPRTPRRRRSSVMFSDVVVAHGMSNSAADVNVCWSEKITQTGGFATEPVASAGSESRQPHHQPSGSSHPSSPMPFNRKSSLRQRVPSNRTIDERRPSCPAAASGTSVPNGAGLTCQELLALSGALGAALPTPLALPNYPSDEPTTTAMVVAPPAKHSNNHKCNNQLLAPPGMMPILPTLAMSLWPEPFQEPGLSGDWTTMPCVNAAETAVDVETDNEDDCICCSSDEEYSASDEDVPSEDQNEDYYEEDEEQQRASVQVFERRRSPFSRYCSLIKEYYKTFQRSVKALVEHKYFQQGLLGAILINTLSMGIEYHNQPEELTLTVEFSNVIFSAIFAIEMLLKVIAEGPLNYVGNGFNVFDGVIVILSLVEVFQSLNRFEGDDGGSSGLSVLRTFRLLRILKLVRFMPNLRRQLVVMLRTMDNVAVFFALLVLFIFIFSILGMNLFGCKFCRKTSDQSTTCDRKNFDSLLWAIVTVFQILTQEDWNVVLFNGMEKTSHWAALYFVALMTFGNYVLFNLLVAILVEGFSAERTERLEREQREQARQERHAARALATAAALSIQDEAASNGSCHGDQETGLPPPDRSSADSPSSADGRHPQEHDNYFSRSSVTEESCSPVGYCANVVEDVVDSAQLADLLLEEERKQAKLALLESQQQRRLKENSYNAIQEQQRRESLHSKSQHECANHYDPKSNIERETMLLCQPSVVSRSEFQTRTDQPSSASGSHLLLPPTTAPIITTTAATPQGSPNATLDSISSRGDSVRLSPLKSVKLVGVSPPRRTSAEGSPLHGDSNINLGLETLGSPSLLRTPSNRSCASSRSSRRSSLNPIMPSRGILSRKSSLAAPSGGGMVSSPEESADTNSLLPSSEMLGSGVLRQGSKKLWRRLSSRDAAGVPATGSHADLEAELEEDRTSNAGNYSLLNNLNNQRQPSCSNHDRLACNGSAQHDGIHQPFTRKPILSHQNSFGSPTTLSPQNSIRSNGSSPRSPSPGFNNLAPNNNNNGSSLNFSMGEGQTGANSTTKTEEEVVVKKRLIVRLYERFPQLKEREDYALFILSPENSIRRSCNTLVTKSWFDHGILFFIGLNCVTLAMERPLIPPDSYERAFLSMSNYVFTFVFAIEMMLKVFAVGMFYGHNAYFTSGWNIMDGLLVTVSIVDILMSILSSGSPRIFGILRVFRLLRSLRPLRVINRAPGLKLVVQTLLSSLKPIGNIVLICCTFFIIFGILGVQLFKGSFFYCEGPNIRSVRNRTDCLAADPRNMWVNRAYNFDDLGQALMALFVLSSKDGWVNIMYTGLDAVGVDQQPIENYSEWRLIYFISFLLLVGFFVLNMFVGVVVENFHRCREEQEKEERARRMAKRARKMEKKRRIGTVVALNDVVIDGTDPGPKPRAVRTEMRRPPYYTNYSRSRLLIHNVVTSKYFDLAIAAVIGLNVVTMAMEFYLMPPELESALRIFNYFFTAVFIIESVCKVVALGVKRYIRDRWNQLDVAIVILSIVGIVLEEMKSDLIPINPTIIRVMRVLRIARVLKLLKMAKGIRSLLDTVMQALPQVGNLGLLFYLLFFIFAALGVELFGRLECDDEHPCQGLGEHAHFANFGIAFLTLFRVATGDNWNGIMKDTLRENCDASADCIKNCCVSRIIAPIFFVIFVLMAQFVLVNVVVAVLMKHLEESHKQTAEEKIQTPTTETDADTDDDVLAEDAPETNTYPMITLSVDSETEVRIEEEDATSSVCSP
ncbi:voltage-dependent T-type calcium channel subunit alpha-1G-like isoform X2 [Daphnia carinata]|uniref:voltage-dependent T-type calcium channel subunit alpha-1G-like isoform X2 n=1 Tax=Daphnia carinata TaxID=120202 RepID=UPI002868CC14|nr:voltage-dependent T-type calcium channel subunit alpha-1G-like isoform X2 [Daphnia carinata]